MKSLLTTLLILFIATLAGAQEGYYVYEDKDKDLTETIDILPGGRFIYQKIGAWSSSRTSGTWKLKGESSIVLNSEFQVDDILVTEETNPTLSDKILITFSAPKYEQGPRKIERLILNENPNLGCVMLSDRMLADAEARNKTLLTGTAAQRDSIKKAYPHVYFECNSKGIDSLQQIDIEFDGKKIKYNPEKGASNQLTIVFRLSEDSYYRYFNDEILLFERRFLISSNGATKYKKSRH